MIENGWVCSSFWFLSPPPSSSLTSCPEKGWCIDSVCVTFFSKNNNNNEEKCIFPPDHLEKKSKRRVRGERLSWWLDRESDFLLVLLLSLTIIWLRDVCSPSFSCLQELSCRNQTCLSFRHFSSCCPEKTRDLFSRHKKIITANDADAVIT